MRWLLALLTAASIVSCGQEQATRQRVMPENNLNLEDRFFATSMSEVTFNQVIDSVEKVYRPIIAGLGGQLVIERNWWDSTVNAYAERQGAVWKVSMFGGLARRPEITPLGFMMVLCHEVAHHIGGYPTYQNDWASNEGNSDYAGVSSCMKKVLANTPNNVQFLSPVAVSKCKRYYKGQKLRVCYNVMSGAKSCANLLGALGGATPSFDTPDKSVVQSTSDAHPAAQCRLDTMSNAAVCQAPWDDRVIPNRSNYKMYSCTVGSEDFRPRCWFAN